MARPYQPLLFRLLHGVTALFVLASLISGYWVYNQFDGRFGRLAIPEISPIIDIHGSLALGFWLFVPLFIAYSLIKGRHRLFQPQDVQRLSQWSQPSGGVVLHRISNTAMLGAIALVWVSGKLMEESWLPTGELNHWPYLLHLIGWLVMVVSLLVHVLMAARVGGPGLLQSMMVVSYRPADSPRHWPTHVQTWLQTHFKRSR